MIGHTIRQRLMLLTLIVLFLTLFGGMFIAMKAFSATLRENVRTQLAKNASYLKILLNKQQIPDSADLDAYAQATSLRITLVNQDGWVLYDSDFDFSAMDNHYWRTEIYEAMQKGSAFSERKSATQSALVVYHAIRIDGHPDIAVLRVSMPLSQLTGYQRIYEQLLFSGLAILVVLVVGITAISINMITKPLQKIKETAKRYADGDLEARMSIQSPRELADLAATMSEMSIQLKNKIAEIESARLQAETILQSITEGILLVDRNLVVLSANQAAKKLLWNNRNEEEFPIEGVRLVQLISSASILEACQQTFEDGKVHEVVTAHYDHLFGETAELMGRSLTKTLRLITTPVLADSIASQVVITITDTTETKRLEQIRKDFVANVSHELKTPITAIAGSAHALIEGAKDDPQENDRFLSIINRQAQHMQNIVEDLLLLSSLEQQNTSLTRLWVSPRQIIDETMQMCRYRAQEKGSIIETSLSNLQDLPIFVNGMLIVQALSNLIVNAIAYSDAGSTIHLDAEVDEEQVVFKVKDVGCGIPKEAQQRIFERFYRVDAARSRGQGGTGLGLSIVKHIAQVHQGTITVESEVGIGSTFTLTIPRKGSDLQSMKKRSDSLYETKGS